MSDDMKEEQLPWDMKAEVVKNDVCVAFTKKLPAIKRTYEKTDVTPTSRISLIHKCAHNVWWCILLHDPGVLCQLCSSSRSVWATAVTCFC